MVAGRDAPHTLLPYNRLWLHVVGFQEEAGHPHIYFRLFTTLPFRLQSILFEQTKR